MSDFENKLNAILSDPSAMARIAGIARSLTEDPSEPSQEDPPDPPAETGAPASDSPPDLASLTGLFGQLDPTAVQKLLPLLSGLSGPGGSQREQLLAALQPFLKPERRDKLQKAVRTARLISMGKTVLGTLGDGYV